MKKLRIYFLIILFSSISFWISFPVYATSDTTEFHKAFVKVRSFSFVNDSLVYFNSSIGVIIDPSGIVLVSDTGIHQRDGKGIKLYDMAYEVCLYKEIGKSPLCLYNAQLIEENSDLDFSLLQITLNPSISGETSFSYLPLASPEEIQSGVHASIFAFLDDDRDILLQTQGNIESVQGEWLKTSLVSPYTFTGAGVVGDNGSLLGITNLDKIEYIAKNGYARGIDQKLLDWINDGKSKSPKVFSAQQRMEELTRVQYDGNSDHTFTFIGENIPEISFTKDLNWQFSQFGDKQLKIKNSDGEKRGKLIVHILPSAYTLSERNILPRIKQFLNEGSLLVSSTITEGGVVSIGSKIGKKFFVDLGNGMKREYYGIPYKHYLVLFILDNGEGDRDKDTVESFLQSVIWNDNKPISYTEIHSYEAPSYSFVTPDNMPIGIVNEKNYPFYVEHENIPEAFISFRYLPLNGWGGTNDDYMKYLEKAIELETTVMKARGISFEVTYKSAYARYPALPDMIQIDSQYIKIDTGEVKMKTKSYYIRLKNEYLRVFLTLLSSDTKLYEKAASETEFMLQRLSSEEFSFVPNKPYSPPPGLDEKPLDSLEVEDMKMYEKMKGWILLKVEGKGEAYYVHPYDKKLYYLGRPLDAFGVMKAHGSGAGTDTIYRLPWNLDELTGQDTDRDGLPDVFEDAIKTDKKIIDSDKDGVNDRKEIEKGDHPMKNGKLPTAKAQDRTWYSGRILLQVDNHGEAWYVNPHDTKAYFLNRPNDAFSIMRKLGRGISNKDFESLTK